MSNFSNPSTLNPRQVTNPQGESLDTSVADELVASGTLAAPDTTTIPVTTDPSWRGLSFWFAPGDSLASVASATGAQSGIAYPVTFLTQDLRSGFIHLDAAVDDTVNVIIANTSTDEEVDWWFTAALTDQAVSIRGGAVGQTFITEEEAEQANITPLYQQQQFAATDTSFAQGTDGFYEMIAPAPSGQQIMLRTLQLALPYRAASSTTYSLMEAVFGPSEGDSSPLAGVFDGQAATLSWPDGLALGDAAGLWMNIQGHAAYTNAVAFCTYTIVDVEVDV